VRIETQLTLKQLRAFAAVYRHGKLASAAEELGVTHGTISRRVQTVETWLGTRLFEREPRGVSLSPAGQRFVAETDRALRIIAQTAEQWRPRRGIPVVRVSAVPAFAKLWLLPRLNALQGDPADLRVELMLEHRLADVISGQADVALRYGKGEWPGVDARALFKETLYPVAAPGLVAAIGTGATAETIAGLPLLHDSDVSQWRAWLSGSPGSPTPIEGSQRSATAKISRA
jgi:LysR family transcriptional regulator, glycine cleavage system transcriptional activator